MLDFSTGKEAKLQYLPGSYRQLQGGDHVVCAVTGACIPLADLRYWSHELQEAYASAEAAGKRYAEAHAAGLL